MYRLHIVTYLRLSLFLFSLGQYIQALYLFVRRLRLSLFLFSLAPALSNRITEPVAVWINGLPSSTISVSSWRGRLTPGSWSRTSHADRDVESNHWRRSGPGNHRFPKLCPSRSVPATLCHCRLHLTSWQRESRFGGPLCRTPS